MLLTTWLDVLGLLANFMFCGATVYIALVEHPARMHLPTRQAVQCFCQSYARALILQPALLRTTFIASALRLSTATSSLRRAHAINLFSSLIIMVCSKKLIIPVGSALLAADQLSDQQARQLLQTWGQRHIARTVLACFTAVTFLTLQLGLVCTTCSRV